MKTSKAKSDPLPLRPAAEADIKPLAQLWYDGWHLGHASFAPAELIQLRTRDSFETRIRDSLPNCHVSGPIGAPIAFARIIDDDLDQFYVDPSATGQGLGRRLMASAEAHFRKTGMTRPHLFCAYGNARAESFYTAMGWENCGIKTESFETSAGPYTVKVMRFEKSL